MTGSVNLDLTFKNYQAVINERANQKTAFEQHNQCLIIQWMYLSIFTCLSAAYVTMVGMVNRAK
jgi:hypothetical protein